MKPVKSATLLITSTLVLNAGVLPIRQDWRLQSNAVVEAGGEIISSSSYQPSGWYTTKVPATVLAALVENRVYPDPYYGLNMKSIPGFKEGRWMVMPPHSPFRSSWWYRNEFSVPADFARENVSLHLDGINYQANVWMNGRQIADSKTCVGAFRRFEFPVRDVIKPGRNVLAVEIIAPGQGPDIVYRTKQIEATTGWDDHNPQPPDLNMGIWRDVYLTSTGPVAIRNPHISSKLDTPSLSAAHLTVTVDVRNIQDRPVSAEVAGEIENIRFAQAVELGPRESKRVEFTPDRYAQLNIAKPRVWWPVGLGKPELYLAKLAVRTGGRVSDSADVRFGIREATTKLNEEGWREYWVNGRRVLIRGGAWMTADMLLRLDPRRYEALIRYAKEANLNMLRSEGFSVRETDEFYELCDRYGIMVTQQLFGRSIPDEKLAVECVRDTILRIRNHPSLVHFLGHDETFPTESLDKAYRELIAKYIPDRTYQPHSGAFDVKERFQTGGTRTGTRELWTYASPAHYYFKKEDGAWGFAQSGGIGGVVSPYESMRRMMPKPDLWPPFTPAWSFHTVLQGGRYFDAMLKALETRYGKPSGIEEFCLRSQAMNYESARGMFEAYGRNKYSATGITPWKYDAAWPASPTWQYIDWYLMAGGAYYGAKKACEPLHVQYSYDDRSVWVVNNRSAAVQRVKVTARVLDLELRERFANSATLDVGADATAKAMAVSWPEDISTTFFVLLSLADAQGNVVSENRYWLSTMPDIPGDVRQALGGIPKYKSMADFTALSELSPAEVKSSAYFEQSGVETVGSVQVANAGKSVAFLVHAGVLAGEQGDEITPAYWDDNYIILLPGESRRVTVRINTSDLGGRKPVLRVGWWNRANSATIADSRGARTAQR